MISPEFIARVLREGRLAEAQARAAAGTSQARRGVTLPGFSSWALVCEEVVDTDHDASWYDDIVAELERRGLGVEVVNRMRAFAWETAGWLNYDMMLWDWVSLDEADIRLALDMQRERGLISLAEWHEGVRFLEDPTYVRDSSQARRAGRE